MDESGSVPCSASWRASIPRSPYPFRVSKAPLPEYPQLHEPDGLAIVGWFVTWPVEKVNGWMVSDRAHHRTLAEDVFPTDLLATVTAVDRRDAIAAMPRFINAESDPSRANPSDCRS